MAGVAKPSILNETAQYNFYALNKTSQELTDVRETKSQIAPNKQGVAKIALSRDTKYKDMEGVYESYVSKYNSITRILRGIRSG